MSGSSQNNKLVICDNNDPDKPLDIVQELSDHTNTITGLLELNNRLLSCGIDKNIVVYDIVEK